jgi:hypothetical protein
MAHDVFICHSAKDKTTADAVCAMLESNGVRCWIAPRDVTPGMEWSECIIDAIEECRVMVLVFTTNANESGQIRREIERAVNRGVAILPIRIEDILPARALEYFIGNVHWLDALTPPLESHIQNLAGTVKILLGRLPQHGASIPHAGTATAKPESIAESHSEPPENLFAEYREAVRPNAAVPPTPLSVAIREERSRATPTPPVEVPKTKRRWPPVGVIIVAILGFITASAMIVGASSDVFSGRTETADPFFFLFAAADITASIGLLKLKKWGRWLKITHDVASACFLVGIADKPYHEGSSSLALWIVLMTYLIAVVLYMFNAHVKQVFRKAQ